MIYNAGEYVNGAISPFTAGELAKGAFANGREAYGWDIVSRWPVTHYREVRHVTGYELTKKYVDVRWIMTDKGMRYNVRGPAKTINAHFLLPEGRGCRKLLVNGADAPFADTAVDQSRSGKRSQAFSGSRTCCSSAPGRAR